MRVVYVAQTLSLASVEFFVHFGRLESAIKLISFHIAIPNGLVEEFQLSALPSEWDRVPSGTATANIGTTWLRNNASAVLKVPSALIKGEYNYLINPAHQDAGQIKVVERSSFSYDSRMWK